MTTDLTTTDHIAGHLRPGGHPPGGVRDNPDVRVQQDRLPATYEAFLRLAPAGPAETAAVVQTLALFGHAVDNGDAGLLAEVFAADVALPQVNEPDRRLPAHHTVNTQVKRAGDRLVAWSRLVTVAGDGSVATADALDVLADVEGRWRVERRTLHPRHGASAALTDGSTPW